MKIICISKKLPGRLEEEYLYLTVGKIYDWINKNSETAWTNDPMIEIRDDKGENAYYHTKCFNLLEYNRCEKLNELGI